MENSSLNWQDSLNIQLLQRLVLLGQQPGIIKQDIGQKIIDRCDRFLNRLPLLSQYLQRWQGINEMSVDSVPIVYALPSLRESENNERVTVNQVNNLESGNNESVTVNQVNNLASNTEKTIQAKTESSQTPSAPINYFTEKRKSVTDKPIVVQPSTVNELSPSIEMPLVTHAESLEAIANSSKMIPSKSRSENPDSIGNNKKNNVSLTQYQTVYPLSIIDNILSSNQRYSLINKQDSLPIAKNINRNSNFSDREYLIVNPLLSKNLSKLLSQNKPMQERPLSWPISSTHSSLVNYSKNTKQIFNRSLEEPITEESLVEPIILEQEKVKLPVVKISTQSPSENRENALPMSPSSYSKTPRINAKTVSNKLAIAAPLPLASRSPSLPSSSSLDVQKRSLQQKPEIPNVFAASSPPTETRISPMQTSPPKVNLEEIAHQVERKIMRRLVIESERRGQKR